MLTSSGVLFYKSKIAKKNCKKKNPGSRPSSTLFKCKKKSYFMNACATLSSSSFHSGMILTGRWLPDLEVKPVGINIKANYGMTGWVVTIIMNIMNIILKTVFTLFLSWLVGGGCLMTCLTVCISVSIGNTLIALNKLTRICCSSQVWAITC